MNERDLPEMTDAEVEDLEREAATATESGPVTFPESPLAREARILNERYSTLMGLTTDAFALLYPYSKGDGVAQDEGWQARNREMARHWCDRVECFFELDNPINRPIKKPRVSG